MSSLKTLGMSKAHVDLYNDRFCETDTERQSTGLQVICCGLPRTGTLSLKTALTRLYRAKCYHMMDVIVGDQDDIDIWTRAADGRVTRQEWRQFFISRNYSAGADFPFALFYQDILEAFPDAKVVLSAREEADSWYLSVRESIWQFHLLARRWSVGLVIRLLDRRRHTGRQFYQVIEGTECPGCSVTFGEAIARGPETARQFYLDWEAEVRRRVPPGRLLTHRAADGWEPLCAFLGLPVPDEPYPNVNDKASILAGVRVFRVVSWIIEWGLPLTIVVAILFVIAHLSGFL